MNYSDYWRINKSSIRYAELANALKGIQKVIGHLGVKAEVVWTERPSGHEEKIELPLSLVSECPIPAEKMDVLVGTAVHQAIHILENSQQVRDYLSSMDGEPSLQKFVEMAEDIHVDGFAKKKGLFGNYVQKLRAWWVNEIGLNINYSLPFSFSLDTLFEIWGHIMLDEVFPNIPREGLKGWAQLSPRMDVDLLAEVLSCSNEYARAEVKGILMSIPNQYLAPLKLLLSRTFEVLEYGPASRASCYRNLWVELHQFFEEWEAETDSSMSSSCKGGPGPVSPIAEMTSGQEAEELTPQLKNTLNQIGEKRSWLLFPTVFEDSHQPTKTAPNLELARRLREVFHFHQREASRVNRGLRGGKIDGRRLYRVYTTSLLFKQRERVVQGDRWNITLLLDASDSMAENWSLVEGIYVALAEALKERRHKLEILAYEELNANCVITRLLNGEALFTTTPAGNTPSGQAIMVAALKLSKGKRRLILHLTDGFSNVGLDVSRAMDFCQLEGIELFTLGFGDELEVFRKKYKKNFKLVGSIEQLPFVLASLLREKLHPSGRIY
jgi:hypothetical protein